MKLLVDPIKSEISTLQDGIKRRNRKLKKIEDDYTDDLITAASFSTMQTRIRSELAEITKDLKKKEAEYNLFPSFDELCEHLDLGKIYNATDCKSKAYLLQAIFPKGFTILKPEYKLRTPFANPFVSITNSKSITYTRAEKKVDNFLPTIPDEGGRWVSNPRPPEPQSGALTS